MNHSIELANEAVRLAIQLWKSDFLKTHDDEPHQVDMFLRKVVANVRAGEVTHSDASLALIIGQISAFPTAVKHGQYDQLSKRVEITSKAIDKIVLPVEQKEILRHIVSNFKDRYILKRENKTIYELKTDENIPKFLVSLLNAYRAYVY